MPVTSTDDYMAVEITDGGIVKLTIDMGAGVHVVESRNAITYGQWHQLIVDRRGYYVTMNVVFEESKGLFIEDKVENDPLPRKDVAGRPFGSVFNLHKEYSKLYVGGFPNDAHVQEVIRSTSMEGQIEGLTIGGHDIGLWNYKVAHQLSGALERNKLKKEPSGELRFDG